MDGVPCQESEVFGHEAGEKPTDQADNRRDQAEVEKVSNHLAHCRKCVRLVLRDEFLGGLSEDDSHCVVPEAFT